MLNSQFFPPEDRKKLGSRTGFRYASIGFVAVTCLIVGIMIASQLDLPEVTHADPIINPSSAYPLVERDGTLESPFVRVVEQVTDAVVNISISCLLSAVASRKSSRKHKQQQCTQSQTHNFWHFI